MHADRERPATEEGMSELRVGDRVSGNSEAGRVTGVIKKKISSPIRFKSYTVRASVGEPQGPDLEQGVEASSSKDGEMISGAVSGASDARHGPGR